MADAKDQVEEPKEETPTELSSDEVKAEIIEKYGFDEDVDEEVIGKLVNDKLEDNKKFSTVIRQKIDWRTKAEAKVEGDKQTVAVTPPVQTDSINATDLLQKMDEKFEQRDLDETDLSDELKDKVKSYAKAEGVGIKKALESDYVTFIKQADDNQTKAEDASLGGNGKADANSDYTTSTKFEGDLSTKEGKEEFKKWEEAMRKL